MEQNQPLVSVIVPVYNAKNHIAACLESIRKQSYQNLEILLLNDGSKDVSLSVCRMYANIDKRIVLVDKANSGVSATRNLGLRLASGKYLQFVDSDDTLLPDSTRLLVQKAEEFETDLVIGYYNRVEPAPENPGMLRDAAAALSARVEDEKLSDALDALADPAPKIQPLGFLPEGFLDKEAFARALMEEPASFYFGVMWNKLYRTDIVREHDLTCNEELAWSEDFLFNLSYIRYAERFYSVTAPVYNYVQNPQSICHTKMNPAQVVSVKLNLFNYYKELYERLGLYEDNKLQIYKYLVASAEGVTPAPPKMSQITKRQKTKLRAAEKPPREKKVKKAPKSKKKAAQLLANGQGCGKMEHE